MNTYTQEELTRITATPSTLGVHLGEAFLGRPYRPYKWMLDMESKILAMLFRPGNEVMVVSVPPQSGKAVTLSTRVPTPGGWTTMGEIRPGDQVIGADGHPCNVTWVSETQWRQVHRLHFDDGSTIDAGPEHLWTTFDNGERSAYGDVARREGRAQDYRGAWWDWKSPGSSRGGDVKSATVRDTATLATSVPCESGSKANHSIPHTHPIVLPEAELPVDPWVLGYWLGNGSRGAGTITTGGHHKYGPDLEYVSGRTGGNPRVVGDLHGLVTVPGLITKLKALGIERSKIVPPAYLRASSRQRMDLLHGLMDSDGTNQATGRVSGQVSYSSKDEHLALAVAELAVSLGAKVHHDVKRATLNGVDHGPSYRVTFTPAFCPFSLPRKMALWATAEMTGRGLNRHHRKIVDIEILNVEAPMRCIMVDGPGSLFLCGEQMVPTHNSQYCAVWLPFWWLGRNPYDKVLNVSYSEERAAENGDQVLRLVKRYGRELFDIGVDSQSDSKSNWNIDNGIGGMKSAGILSGITGTPGITLVVCDDVLAGDVQANSPTIKERNVAEWDNSIANRFQENTKALIIATRWADDDLSGEILDRAAQPGYEGYPVTYLNYKAVAEPDPDEIKYMEDDELEEWRDLLGRRMGEVARRPAFVGVLQAQEGIDSDRPLDVAPSGHPVVLGGRHVPARRLGPLGRRRRSLHA